MARLSIKEFAGGDRAWLAFATAFHELRLADPELNHPFSHGTVGPAGRPMPRWSWNGRSPS